MKYDPSVVSSLAQSLGFKNISVKGRQVQFTCPFAEFDEISGHQHGDLWNPSFFVTSCPSDSNYTRWTCPVCERAQYNYAKVKHNTNFYLSPNQKYNIVKRSYRTESFLASLACIYRHYGYPEKASKALSLYISYIMEFSEDVEMDKYNIDPELEYVQKPFYPFPDDWLDSFTTVANVPKALGYIESRGVKSEIAISLGVRFDTEKNMICFPMLDHKTKMVNGLRGRSIDPSAQTKHHWYQKYFTDEMGVKRSYGDSRDPWLNEDRIDFSKPVVVVEGIFDLLKVASFYPNVIAICNKTVAGSKLARIKHVHSLVWLTDSGSAEQDRIAVEKRCKHLNINIHHAYIPPGHTYQDLDGSTKEVKDAGALPFDILIPIVMNAVTIAASSTS